MPETIRAPHTDFAVSGEKVNARQIEFLCRALNPGPYRYFAYGGAIRGGKSYVVLFILHQLSLKFPGSKWVVVRATLPDLKKTTIPSFKKLIDWKHYGKWNNGSPLTFNYRNGSSVVFIPESITTDPDLNAFLGLECSGVFLEQLEELSEKMWQMAMQRSGSLYLDPMPPAYIFTTFNPNQGWSKEQFYDNYTNGTLQAPYYYMPALPKDNPFVTQDQWNAWGNMADRYKLQFIEGDWSNFIDTNNLWAFAFDRKKHVAEPVLDPEHTVFLSFDFNKNPICCSVIQHYDGKVRVLETIKLPNSDIYALCDYITVYYPNLMFMVTGDATGQNTSALVRDNLNYYRIIKSRLNLGDAQLKVPSVNPRLEDNQVLVNSLLAKYEVEIHAEKAKALIYDLGNVKMLPDGTIEKTDRKDPKQQADALDTFRYFCNTFLKWYIKS